MTDAAVKKKPRVTVIGLGNAGLKTVSRLTQSRFASWLNIIAVDTDKESLDACFAENKIQADPEWRNGLGCGGDIINGQRSFSRERPRFAQLISASDLLIVTGGLGGGVCTGGAPIIASVAKQHKIPTAFIMTTPFSFEGQSRRKIADEGIKELLPSVDILLCLPNDLLFATLASDVPVESAFKKADQELATAVLGVAEILRCGNMISADFADFKELLSEKKSVCCIGSGIADSADGLNRTHIALERMLESPLLGSVERLKTADAVIMSLTGGSDMQIGEVKKLLETLEGFIGKHPRVISGVNTDPAYENTVQITVITISYDKTVESSSESDEKPRSLLFKKAHANKAAKAKTSASSAPSQQQFEQGMLPLQIVSKGIFHNTSPAKYRDIDLDIPTFQRESIVIDKGT